KSGSSDLVAYFFLRSASLVHNLGTIGLLATNTIAQGDTGEVGLDQLCERGLTIYRAVRSRAWPGGESLEVSQIWMTHREWNGAAFLDGQPVRGITSELTPRGRVDGKPYPLQANRDRCFNGSKLLGNGFTMPRDEAARLLAAHPRNRDCLQPFL